MDGLEALPLTGGVAAVLVAVILYLLRANWVDRRDYREAVEDCRRGCREDTALLDQRIEAQAVAYRKLQELVDEQRSLRRKAEDEAARSTMATERAAYELASLRDEVALLRAQVAEMKKS